MQTSFGRLLRRPSRTRRQAMLRLEALESREVPATFYVSIATGNDANPGTSALPVRSIQKAVNLALENGAANLTDEIRVAAGTYTYSDTLDNDAFAAANIKAVVEIYPKYSQPAILTIKGGYSTNFSTINPAVNITTINGESKYRGVFVTGANLIAGGGPLVSLTMSGFQVANGRGEHITDAKQAGLENAKYSSPAPESTYWRYGMNGYGGGMLAVESYLALSDMTFSNNIVVGRDRVQGDLYNRQAGRAEGGGLAVFRANLSGLAYPPESSVSLTMQNLVFTSNTAQGGYGYADGGNNPGFEASGGYALGGGVFVAGVSKVQELVVNDPSPTFASNLKFESNKALSGGTNGSGSARLMRQDGMFESLYELSDALGGGAAFQAFSRVSISGVTATSNQAVGGDAPYGKAGLAFGGGLYAEYSVVNIKSDFQSESKSILRIVGNKAQGGNGRVGGYANGGGFFGSDADVALDRGEILQNVSIGGNSITEAGIKASGGTACGGGIGLQRTKGGYDLQIFPAVRGNGYLSNLIIGGNTILHGIWIESGQIVQFAGGGGGGGVFLESLVARLDYVTVANNATDTSLIGEAIVVTPEFANPVVYINNSIIAEHASAKSGEEALRIQGSFVDSKVEGRKALPTVTVTSTMFVGNFGDFDEQPSAKIVMNAANPPYILGSNLKAGFVDTVAHNYRLQSSAIALSFASVPTDSTFPLDIDGEGREATSAIGADTPYHLLPAGGNVATLALPNSTYALFGVSAGGQVYWRSDAATSWSPIPFAIGFKPGGRLAATAVNASTFSVFSTGNDGRLYEMRTTNGGSNWLPPVAMTNPSDAIFPQGAPLVATTFQDGQTRVWAIDSTGLPVIVYKNGSSWTPYRIAGTQIFPAGAELAVAYTGGWSVFAVASDGKIYQTYTTTSGGWASSSPTTHFFTPGSSVTASTADGALRVWGVSTAGKVVGVSYDFISPQWSSVVLAQSQGVTFPPGAAVSVVFDGSANKWRVFVNDVTGRLYEIEGTVNPSTKVVTWGQFNWVDPIIPAVSKPGPRTTGGPTTTIIVGSNVYTFGTDAFGRVLQTTRPTSNSSAWTQSLLL